MQDNTMQIWRLIFVCVPLKKRLQLKKKQYFDISSPYFIMCAPRMSNITQIKRSTALLNFWECMSVCSYILLFVSPSHPFSIPLSFYLSINICIGKRRSYGYGMWKNKLFSIKIYFSIKAFERKIIGQTRVMYKNMNKFKKATENSSPKYTIYIYIMLTT